MTKLVRRTLFGLPPFTSSPPDLGNSVKPRNAEAWAEICVRIKRKGGVQKIEDGNGNRNGNVCLEGYRRTSFIYQDNRIFFCILKLIGLFPCTLNDAGQFEVKLWKLSTCYTGLVLASVSCTALFLMFSELTLMLSVNFAFEDRVLVICLFSSCFIQFTSCVAIFELKKFVRFLNDCSNFGKEFERLTGNKMAALRCSRIGVGMICGGVLMTLTSFLGGYEKLEHLDNKYQLHSVAYFKAMFISFNYCTWVMVTMMMCWIVVNSSLEHCANHIVQDIEGCKWKSVGLQGHIKLWFELRRLCHNAGNVYCWAFVFLFCVIFSLSLPAFFVAIGSVAEGNYWNFLPALSTMLYMSFFAEFSHSTINQVGPLFENRLTRLLMSGKCDAEEKELERLLRHVVSCPPTISLAGFVNMNRGVNVSLYSNIVTYGVIIIQFKSEQPAHSISNTTNSTPI